ncbi:helix-turn-helix domain-containing protein [Acidovorax sp. LjRoot129]|uniref:GlxA family transcriptional regulator n=1 Tax=Acidovorax sp. LjRoot129 TaxID=3342260 RepID=UPI003ECDADFB
MDICLLLADHCSAASATMAQEFFRASNLFADAPAFRVISASWDGQAVPTMSGQMLQVDAAISDVGRMDLVVVPGFLLTLREALPLFERYRPWLRHQHAAGATVASMCTATFLLAECGLLPGVRATTHWAFADFFRRRYPDLLLDETRMLHDEKRVVTSGGASAAMDLLLYLVERFGTPGLAHKCSRYMLIDHVRSGQSAYFFWTASKNHNDAEVLQVQHWLEESFAEPLVIDEVAQRFGFGIRNFKRRFKEATGSAPLAYLQMLRLQKAMQLLETTRQSLESITGAVGYGDSSSFSRLFQSRVGLPPSAYRRKFQVKKR